MRIIRYSLPRTHPNLLIFGVYVLQDQRQCELRHDYLCPDIKAAARADLLLVIVRRMKFEHRQNTNVEGRAGHQALGSLHRRTDGVQFQCALPVRWSRPDIRAL